MNNSENSESHDAKDWNRTSLRWRFGRVFSRFVRVGEVRLIQWIFGQLNAPCRAKIPFHGYDLHLDLSRSDAQKLLYLQGERFVGERVLFKRLIKPGMTVVDVGANIGYHLLLCENLIGPEGGIIAIEPSPENLPELRANVSGNGFKNVRIEATAVGAQNRNVSIRGGINSGILNEGDGIASVPMCPLDELVSEKVDFVKIDVDGYEHEVLAGSMKLLERDRPTVLVELHPHLLPRFGSTVAAVLDLLRRNYSNLEGFDQFRATDESAARRIARRYWHPDRLKTIPELDDVVAMADANQHNWTFWVIARP